MGGVISTDPHVSPNALRPYRARRARGDLGRAFRAGDHGRVGTQVCRQGPALHAGQHLHGARTTPAGTGDVLDRDHRPPPGGHHPAGRRPHVARRLRVPCDARHHCSDSTPEKCWRRRGSMRPRVDELLAAGGDCGEHGEGRERSNLRVGAGATGEARTGSLPATADRSRCSLAALHASWRPDRVCAAPGRDRNDARREADGSSAPPRA
jgi:hypothetical protein